MCIDIVTVATSGRIEAHQSGWAANPPQLYMKLIVIRLIHSHQKRNDHSHSNVTFWDDTILTYWFVLLVADLGWCPYILHMSLHYKNAEWTHITPPLRATSYIKVWFLCRWCAQPVALLIQTCLCSCAMRGSMLKLTVSLTMVPANIGHIPWIFTSLKAGKSQHWYTVTATIKLKVYCHTVTNITGSLYGILIHLYTYCCIRLFEVSENLYDSEI